jgi:hypothetical protein
VESRTLYREELLLTRGAKISAATSLDAAIGQLPKAFWASGHLMLGDADQQPTIRIVRVSLVGERSEILTFDPALAEELNWHSLGAGDFTFVNRDGIPMVTTRFWRDGWEQEMRYGDGKRWAEGQRVELSDAGVALIKRRGGLPRARLQRWRHVEARDPEKRSSSTWISEAPDPL